MMEARKTRQARRSMRSRRHQARLGVCRIVARLSGKHTYAQLIASDCRVLAAASTVEKDVRQALANKGGNITAAEAVGKRLAEKAAEVDLGARLAFDRGGRKYHGRIKALAEAARAGGLQF